MDKPELKRIVDANDWLWEKWWPALQTLSPEQAHQEVGGSFPNVLATTAHMVGAEVVWLERLLGNPAASFPASPADLMGLYEFWQRLASRRQDWLITADPEARITYNFTGGTATNSITEIVLHFTSHAHFHRGQLASQFRLLGLKPPSAHLIGFFRL
ncbi:MAG: DinB family protein [Meiothermus sp.]|nr:DinB family protein [Meiothermus sp.]